MLLVHELNMDEGDSEMSEKRSGAVTMKTECAAVCGPRLWSDTRESWLARGARAAGVTFRQFKAAFYGEITDPEHRTLRRISAAARLRQQEREGRADAAKAIAHLVALRAALASVDADFHSAEIARLDDALRAMGSAVRAVAIQSG